jgi:hypothetical protein
LHDDITTIDHALTRPWVYRLLHQYPLLTYASKKQAAMGVNGLARHEARRLQNRGSDDVKMAEIPLSSAAKVTVERRGQIVLIGLNRPYIHNRVDPETYGGLAAAYQYDHDSSLRAAGWPTRV